MTYRHPLAFPLGIEGMALLRAYAGDAGLGEHFTEDRITEIRRLLGAYDRGELGEGDVVGAIDTVTGYRDWSARYDEETNPLIEVEEPVVLPILAAPAVARRGRVFAAAGWCGRVPLSGASRREILARRLAEADRSRGARECQT
jgi:hypothetical protein